jgi:micrococcal nuclease
MREKVPAMILALVFCVLFMGDIWFWEDKNGTRHFSNIAPPPPDAGKVIQTYEENQQPTQSGGDESEADLFRVTRVLDGDTVQVQGLDLKFAIRLAGIDSPELGRNGHPDQPYAEKAKACLTRLASGKRIRVKSYGTDRYNRQLAEIFVGHVNINLEMLKEGMAEVYTGKLPPGLDMEPYLNAQVIARRKNKGVWGKKPYVSPKEWRKRYPPK